MHATVICQNRRRGKPIVGGVRRRCLTPHRHTELVDHATWCPTWYQSKWNSAFTHLVDLVSCCTSIVNSGLSAAERRRRRVILPRQTPPVHPGVHRRTACILWFQNKFLIYDYFRWFTKKLLIYQRKTWIHRDKSWATPENLCFNWPETFVPPTKHFINFN